MRKASEKVRLAYLEGRRVGISETIESFYLQNGFNNKTFNMTAKMRKEYIDALNYERQQRKKIFGEDK